VLVVGGGAVNRRLRARLSWECPHFPIYFLFPLRWRGDYGGKKQLWFPANYVEERSPTPEQDQTSVENSPLGSFLKGFIDVPTCHVVIQKEGRENRPFVFTIHSQQMSRSIQMLDVACDSQEELSDWVAKIREATQNADARVMQTN
uniref:PH domain-containing protein n=1 Tax=Callorhinchus milii TaxID=7868 RepID=A0A4W3H0B6_CALMI